MKHLRFLKCYHGSPDSMLYGCLGYYLWHFPYLQKSYLFGPRLSKAFTSWGCLSTHRCEAAITRQVDLKFLSLRESKRSSAPPAHIGMGCVLCIRTINKYSCLQTKYPVNITQMLQSQCNYLCLSAFQKLKSPGNKEEGHRRLLLFAVTS